jgi:hypothetical protein
MLSFLIRKTFSPLFISLQKRLFNDIFNFIFLDFIVILIRFFILYKLIRNDSNLLI